MKYPEESKLMFFTYYKLSKGNNVSACFRVVVPPKGHSGAEIQPFPMLPACQVFPLVIRGKKYLCVFPPSVTTVFL